MSVRSAVIDHRSSVAGVILLLLAILVVTVGRADANHQPADKVVASAAIDDITFAAEGETVQLLEETFRTSTTSDLLLQIASECSITTEVTTVGNDTAAARGQLKLHLTIETDGGDPQPVGISQTSTHPTEPGTATDDGSVVFCDRKYERETSLFDDENATIRTFMDTRTANAFNWVQLNAGRGVHTVRLFATYSDADTTDGGESTGVIGRRTMIIEPVKMKNDEHVQDVNVD